MPIDRETNVVEQDAASVELNAVAVADARYLMRRAFRMIDDEAKRSGLDPLEHQLLVQLDGAPDHTRSVTEIATRLDVVTNLVSRIARTLEERELICRLPSLSDRRVTLVRATEYGTETTREIAARVRRRFTDFDNDLTYERRLAALLIWARNFAVQVSADHPADLA